MYFHLLLSCSVRACIFNSRGQLEPSHFEDRLEACVLSLRHCRRERFGIDTLSALKPSAFLRGGLNSTKMSTQYDALSTTYPNAEAAPAQSIISANLRAALPASSVAGLDVLDLACGTGGHTRRLLTPPAAGGWGPAASVLAIDISPGMIAGARAACADLLDPPGRLAFAVGDATTPDLLATLGVPREGAGRRRFDVVLGAWLLNYAASEAELARMWANVASHLKPGGRFVGVVPDLDPPRHVPAPAAADADPTALRPDDVWGDAKYGVTSRPLRKVAGGWHQRVTIRVAPRVEFDNYRLTEEGDALYARCARAAGMTALERRKMLPTEEDVRAREDGFWDDWVRGPSSEIYIACKA